MRIRLGTNVTHFWNFGDGTEVNTTANFIEHTYTQKGYYNITCRSENLASMKENITYITSECIGFFNHYKRAM